MGGGLRWKVGRRVEVEGGGGGLRVEVEGGGRVEVEGGGRVEVEGGGVR